MPYTGCRFAHHATIVTNSISQTRSLLGNRVTGSKSSGSGQVGSRVSFADPVPSLAVSQQSSLFLVHPSTAIIEFILYIIQTKNKTTDPRVQVDAQSLWCLFVLWENPVKVNVITLIVWKAESTFITNCRYQQYELLISIVLLISRITVVVSISPFVDINNVNYWYH